jgi:hypothetical protein
MLVVEEHPARGELRLLHELVDVIHRRARDADGGEPFHPRGDRLARDRALHQRNGLVGVGDAVGIGAKARIVAILLEPERGGAVAGSHPAAASSSYWRRRRI